MSRRERDSSYARLPEFSSSSSSSVPASPRMPTLSTSAATIKAASAAYHTPSQRPSRRFILLCAAAALFILVALLQQNGIRVPEQVVKPIHDQLSSKLSVNGNNAFSKVFGVSQVEKRITLIAMWYVVFHYHSLPYRFVNSESMAGPIK